MRHNIHIIGRNTEPKTHSICANNDLRRWFSSNQYAATAHSFLIVRSIAGQIVLLADLAGLFVLDSLQLGAGGDAMAKAAAVGAAPVPDGLVHLVELRLDGGEEGGHLLLGLNEQMLEIRQHSLVHLHQQ